MLLYLDIIAETKSNYYTRTLCSDEEQQDSVTTQPLSPVFILCCCHLTGFITLFFVSE